jgi:hypothetical protein
MATSINSASDYSAVLTDIGTAAQTPASPPTDATTPADQPSVEQTDTVKLSVIAQARLMERQGQGVYQIAGNLGLSTNMVEQYLGLTADTSTASPSLTGSSAITHP